jgi:hypothetical protein
MNVRAEAFNENTKPMKASTMLKSFMVELNATVFRLHISIPIEKSRP